MQHKTKHGQCERCDKIDLLENYYPDYIYCRDEEYYLCKECFEEYSDERIEHYIKTTFEQGEY